MKTNKNQALVLALALGLLAPLSNAHAMEAANPVENPPAETANVPVETDETLMYTTTVANPAVDEETELEKKLEGIVQEIEETLAEVEEEDENNLDEEEVDLEMQALIDEIDAATAEIGKDGPLKALEEEESILTVKAVPATYIFNGSSKPIQTLQVVDSENGPLANVVSIREYAYALMNTDFKFDVKQDGNKFYLQKGKNYDAGITKKFVEDEIEGYLVEEFTGILSVDGVDTEITGYIVNGEYMVRASVLSKALDFRFRNDVKDSSKLLINTDKSDIAVPTVDELKSEIQKKDYTVLFNWGPWCPWSKHELPIMEKFAQHLLEQRKYDIQLLGLVNRSADYSDEEISVLFDNNKSLWKNYGTDKELYDFIYEMNGAKIAGFPSTFIVDKDFKKQGSEFYNYYEELLNQFLAANNMTEEEYEEKYVSSFDDMEFDDKMKEAVYSNLLAYTIEGKKVELADKDTNVLKEVTIKNEDKPIFEEKEANTSAPAPKAEAKEVKAAKAPAKASSNPKTGVGSVGAIAMAGIVAGAALKKTKRD